MLVLLWISFSVLLGFLSSNKQIGWAGGFFCSLLLSPVIGLIIILVSNDKIENSPKKEIGNPSYTSAFSKDKEEINVDQSISDELIKLVKLKADGHITDSEFEKLKAKIIE